MMLKELRWPSYILILAYLGLMANSYFIWITLGVLLVLDAFNAFIMFAYCGYTCKQRWKWIIDVYQDDFRVFLVIGMIAAVAARVKWPNLIAVMLICFHLGWYSASTLVAKSYLKKC